MSADWKIPAGPFHFCSDKSAGGLVGGRGGPGTLLDLGNVLCTG